MSPNDAPMTSTSFYIDPEVKAMLDEINASGMRRSQFVNALLRSFLKYSPEQRLVEVAKRVKEATVESQKR